MIKNKQTDKKQVLMQYPCQKNPRIRIRRNQKIKKKN